MRGFDTEYLATLSADAVPALVNLPEPARSCVLRRIAFGLDGGGWRDTNLSRDAARALLDGHEPFCRIGAS